MSVQTAQFKNVSYLWDEAKAASMAGDEVALLIYRSNLLGADLRLTNYGGGNTSCKAMAKNPLTGEETEVMWVKGSGGDIGTLKKNGLAALHPVLQLQHYPFQIIFEIHLLRFAIFPHLYH